MRLGVIIGPIIFVLWLFCVIDVIQRGEHEMRSLPKIAWLLIVLFFPLVGSIAWLVAGRTPRDQANAWAHPTNGDDIGFPEYDRPGRATTGDDAADAEFLRKCRERAEEQRRRYREQHPPTDGQ